MPFAKHNSRYYSATRARAERRRDDTAGFKMPYLAWINLRGGRHFVDSGVNFRKLYAGGVSTDSTRKAKMWTKDATIGVKIGPGQPAV